MIDELCKELNNWFDVERHFGVFEIEDGELSVPFLQDGQYFRIVGSIFNDGVHQHPTTGLTDETFDGAVWAMAVPDAVIALSAEIDEWKEKYAGVDSAAMSPFTSESFGGYSYSKSGGASGANGISGSTGSWQNAFANRLSNWRKIRP